MQTKQNKTPKNVAHFCRALSEPCLCIFSLLGLASGLPQIRKKNNHHLNGTFKITFSLIASQRPGKGLELVSTLVQVTELRQQGLATSVDPGEAKSAVSPYFEALSVCSSIIYVVSLIIASPQPQYTKYPFFFLRFFF